MPYHTQIPGQYGAYDPAQNTVVPVIASYNVNGDCMPLYFRYTNSDGSYSYIPIFKVIDVQSNPVLGINYQCEYINQSRRQRINLYFHRKENKWSMRPI